MMPYPAAMDRSAARIEDAYAQKRATPSILDAFLPSLVIDGAIKPMMINGTQKLIISDKIYFTVTTIFITASPAAFTDSRPASCPAMIPITTPRSSLNGRLENSFFILSSLSLLFFPACREASVSPAPFLRVQDSLSISYLSCAGKYCFFPACLQSRYSINRFTARDALFFSFSPKPMLLYAGISSSFATIW